MRNAPRRSTGLRGPLGLLVGAALLGTALLAHSRARGDEGGPGERLQGEVTAPQMRAEMHRYFDGEWRGGIGLVSVGAGTVALGTGLSFQQSDFGRGLGYAVLAVGALELLGGAAFMVNTWRRVPRFDRQLDGAPLAFKGAELPRIQGVNRDMRRLEVLEISLIVASSTLTGVSALQGHDLLAGIGTGVLIQSVVLLVYDQLAARRALRYTDSLLRF